MRDRRPRKSRAQVPLTIATEVTRHCVFPIRTIAPPLSPEFGAALRDAALNNLSNFTRKDSSNQVRDSKSRQ
jgi:hypothetical protein